MWWELAGSVLRHFTPWALTALGAIGVELPADTDPVVLVVMGAVAFGIAQIWSIARKVLNKPRAE